MRRREFLEAGLGAVSVGVLAGKLFSATREERFESAVEILAKATATNQVDAATLYIRHKETVLSKHFGNAKSMEAMFLLGSISKPISVAALMTHFEKNVFGLDDLVKKHLPEFQGEQRGTVTVRQLLTHVSGLPDQLPENAKLRKSHAPIEDFVQAALRTPLLFAPGKKYSYSSMGILLAVEIARRATKMDFRKFIDHAVFQTLGMKHSALGIGKFQLADFQRGQIEKAAVESGAGDPAAKDWDWNSPYWRKFGAPWGGLHASAPDVARFLEEFLHPKGKMLTPQTARLMIQNHNPKDFPSRGLGFDVGISAGSPGCSEATFGHTGSTGTLAWADPQKDLICVVLTSLPGRAVNPHPRKLVSDQIARVV